MSPATLSQRMGVLGMGDRVIAQIAKGDIDYYAAVRTNEVSRTLERRRPKLVEELGGTEKVRDRLLEKARHRKGMTRELELIVTKPLIPRSRRTRYCEATSPNATRRSAKHAIAPATWPNAAPSRA